MNHYRLMNRRRGFLHALAAALVAVVLVAGCSARNAASFGAPTEVSFDVQPDYLDDAYTAPGLGVEFRPPLGWKILDPEQRDRVAAALLAQQQEEAYNLQIVDLFLQTDTLSFASLSRVTSGGEPVTDRADYEQSFSAGIDATDESDFNERVEFTVGGIAVTQYRHMRGDRVTFTLLFDAADGSLLQLDYSIPSDAYEQEGVKLESSIGTLQRIDTEEP